MDGSQSETLQQTLSRKSGKTKKTGEEEEAEYVLVCVRRRKKRMYTVKHIAVLNENASTYIKNTNVHSVPMMNMEIDVDALEQELRTQVRGEVRFDEGSRALYTTDASNYRQVPIGVVIPKDGDDVVIKFDIPDP